MNLSSQLSQAVSIHPYFKVQAGQMDAAKAILRRFVATTTLEETNLYYDFSISGDVVFCREAYTDADALLRHIGSIGEILAEFLQIAEVARVELHGPAAELDKLRAPLADLNAEFYVLEVGVQR